METRKHSKTDLLGLSIDLVYDSVYNGLVFFPPNPPPGGGGGGGGRLCGLCVCALYCVCVILAQYALCVSGAVNMPFFAWTVFLRAMYKFPFIHSS